MTHTAGLHVCIYIYVFLNKAYERASGSGQLTTLQTVSLELFLLFITSVCGCEVQGCLKLYILVSSTNKKDTHLLTLRLAVILEAIAILFFYSLLFSYCDIPLIKETRCEDVFTCMIILQIGRGPLSVCPADVCLSARTAAEL